jgi:hypothetical protein
MQRNDFRSVAGNCVSLAFLIGLRLTGDKARRRNAP